MEQVKQRSQSVANFLAENPNLVTMQEYVKGYDEFSAERICNNIFTMKNQCVLFDREVAYLYGIGIRDINKAIKKNPDKFPEGYIFELVDKDFETLRDNLFSTITDIKAMVHSKAFTEKGLYMLATIFDNPRVTKASIGIIEAFVKLRKMMSSGKELTRTYYRYKRQQHNNYFRRFVGMIIRYKKDADANLQLNPAVFGNMQQLYIAKVKRSRNRRRPKK
jgi:hypothetical protein